MSFPRGNSMIGLCCSAIWFLRYENPARVFDMKRAPTRQRIWRNGGPGLVTTSGGGRHDELIRASAGVHLPIENSPAWKIVRVPTRRIGERRARTCGQLPPLRGPEGSP